MPNQSAAPQPSLPGFDQFMMTRFSPLCWAIPTNPSFEPKDAQGRQALGEAAGLQKAIYTKIGQEYLTWVRDVELKGMGMNSGMMEEYLRALSTLDGKAFRHFFQVSSSSQSTFHLDAPISLTAGKTGIGAEKQYQVGTSVTLYPSFFSNRRFAFWRCIGGVMINVA